LHFHTAADLDAAALSALQRRIRSGVLRLAVRHGALTPEVAADLARWGHGGGFTCPFDQPPWRDSTASASEPSLHFDQTLN
jgi:hypothetical protein